MPSELRVSFHLSSHRAVQYCGNIGQQQIQHLAQISLTSINKVIAGCRGPPDGSLPYSLYRSEPATNNGSAIRHELITLAVTLAPRFSKISTMKIMADRKPRKGAPHTCSTLIIKAAEAEKGSVAVRLRLDYREMPESVMKK